MAIGDQELWMPGEPLLQLDQSRYAFMPREDITLQDLARVIQMMGLEVPSWVFKSIPPDVQLHFQMCVDAKGNRVLE